jgi:hypothetical protein
MVDLSVAGVLNRFSSEAEIALRSSETCRVHTSMYAACRSVPIAFRTTMVMKIKDLPAAASFTFEGALHHGFGQDIQWVGR